jgi:hypothetical protein
MPTKNIYCKKKETNIFISEYYKLLIKIFQNLVSIRKYYIQIINSFNDIEKKKNNREIITNKLDCIFELYKNFYCSYFDNKKHKIQVYSQQSIIDQVNNTSVSVSIINYNNFIKKSRIIVDIYKKIRNNNGIDEYFICIEYEYNNLKFYTEKKYEEDPQLLDIDNICILLFNEFLELKLPISFISQLPINLIIESDDCDSALLLTNPVISFDYFRMKIINFYSYWGNEKKIVEEINCNIFDIKNILNSLNYNFYFLNCHNLD